MESRHGLLKGLIPAYVWRELHEINYKPSLRYPDSEMTFPNMKKCYLLSYSVM